MTLPAALRRPTADGLLVIAGTGAILAMLLVRTGQRAASSVDYDDGVYWQTALAISSGHEPYAEVFFSQPPLYAWLLALPFRLGASEDVARLLTLGWAGLLIWAAGMLGRAVAGRYAGLAAALAVALLPPVQRYCFQFGADLPAAALAAAALVAAGHARVGPARRRWWLIAGALLGTAVLTKLLAVAIVPALVVVALGRRRALVWISVGAAAAVVAWLGVLRPAPAQAWRQVVLFHLTASGDALPPGSPGAIAVPVVWILPFALLCAIGTVVTLRRMAADARRPAVALLVWGCSGLLFGALYRPLFEHHLLFFVTPGAVFVACGAVLLIRGLGPRWTRAAVVAACAIGIAQAISVPVLPRWEGRAMQDCLRTLPRDALVLTDDQEIVARAGLRVPPGLADTSRVRISSGYLPPEEIVSAGQSATAVLLAPPQRARIVDPTVLDWIDRRFTARYAADGYRLYTPAPDQLAGCR